MQANRRTNREISCFNYIEMRRGFTIIEILVVISIIALLAVVAVSATNAAGAGTGSKQGAVIASDILALTRSEAVLKQAYAILIVDAYQDPSNPGNFLHRVIIADATGVPVPVPGATGANTVTQVSTWYDLPTGVYFDPKWSTPSTTVPITITGLGGGTIFNAPAYVYTFTPIGQLASPGQLVLAVGHESVPLSSGPSFEDGTSGTPDTRQGFYIHLLGRPSFFQTPGSIPTAQ